MKLGNFMYWDGKKWVRFVENDTRPFDLSELEQLKVEGFSVIGREAHVTRHSSLAAHFFHFYPVTERNGFNMVVFMVTNEVLNTERHSVITWDTKSWKKHSIHEAMQQVAKGSMNNIRIKKVK